MKQTEDSGSGGGGFRKIARSLFGSRGDTDARDEAGAQDSNERANTPADGAKILDDLLAWACEISQEELSLADVDPDVGIFDAGYVDSMSYVEILARIDERYGVAVPDDQVVGSSFNDLARYVAERRDA